MKFIVKNKKPIMRCIVSICCLLSWPPSLNSQIKTGDSSVYVPGELKDGILISYDDLRRNSPVIKEKIISKLDKDQLEFVGKVMSQDKVSYVSNGMSLSVETKSVWGYFQNNSLHLNYNGDFYRVPVFGAICYLVANVQVPGVGFYDSRFGPTGANMPTTEVREFIMNFYDGEVTEFTNEKAEGLLARDEALYAEYKKLSRKKRRERLYQYIRKYNDRHPVYFLK